MAGGGDVDAPVQDGQREEERNEAKSYPDQLKTYLKQKAYENRNKKIYDLILFVNDTYSM